MEKYPHYFEIKLNNLQCCVYNFTKWKTTVKYLFTKMFRVLCPFSNAHLLYISYSFDNFKTLKVFLAFCKML